MRAHLLGILGLALATTAIPFPAQASRVSPMSVEMEPFGRSSIARVQFVNTADMDFPLEARAYAGVISEEGELSLVPADDDFIIFPPLQTVAPRGEQVFRVQYIGEPELPEAKVYYLSIRQLPVELEPGSPKIQVLINFNVFLNVEPDDSEASPMVTSITASTLEEAEGLAVDGIEVRVANEGNGMLLAGKRNWELSGRNNDGSVFQRRYEAAELGTIIGVGVVAPSRARKFFLPLAEGVDPSSLSIAIE